MSVRPICPMALSDDCCRDAAAATHPTTARSRKYFWSAGDSVEKPS